MSRYLSHAVNLSVKGPPKEQIESGRPRGRGPRPYTKKQNSRSSSHIRGLWASGTPPRRMRPAGAAAASAPTAVTPGGPRPIRILRITPDVVAVSKPPGVAFHTDAAGRLGLVALLRQQLQAPPTSAATADNPAARAPAGRGGGVQQPLATKGDTSTLPERLWPVHRLDAITSGCALRGRPPRQKQAPPGVRDDACASTCLCAFKRCFACRAAAVAAAAAAAAAAAPGTSRHAPPFSLPSGPPPA
jgi:23S rRNA-/tRNA-specific pseudouridylate synthase